jgi:glycyl-tRNA synthetase
LGQHGKFSGKDLAVQKEENSKDKEIPHIIEIAFGVDRPVFALLDIFYDKKSEGEGKTVFRIPGHLAPVHAAVFPLLNKDGLPELAQQVYSELKKIQDIIVKYDSTASIGKRYLREAEAGTPFCITIDHQSKEDHTVTIRERDSEMQKRVKISHLSQVLEKLVSGSVSFKDLE